MVTPHQLGLSQNHPLEEGDKLGSLQELCGPLSELLSKHSFSQIVGLTHGGQVEEAHAGAVPREPRWSRNLFPVQEKPKKVTGPGEPPNWSQVSPVGHWWRHQWCFHSSQNLHFWAQTNRPEQGWQAPSDTDDPGEKSLKVKYFFVWFCVILEVDLARKAVETLPKPNHLSGIPCQQFQHSHAQRPFGLFTCRANSTSVHMQSKAFCQNRPVFKGRNRPFYGPIRTQSRAESPTKSRMWRPLNPLQKHICIPKIES